MTKVSTEEYFVVFFISEKKGISEFQKKLLWIVSPCGDFIFPLFHDMPVIVVVHNILSFLAENLSWYTKMIWHLDQSVYSLYCNEIVSNFHYNRDKILWSREEHFNRY